MIGSFDRAGTVRATFAVVGCLLISACISDGDRWPGRTGVGAALPATIEFQTALDPSFVGDSAEIVAANSAFTGLPLLYEKAGRTILGGDAETADLVFLFGDDFDCRSLSLSVNGGEINGCRPDGCRLTGRLTGSRIDRLVLAMPARRRDATTQTLVQGACQTAAVLLGLGDWEAWSRISATDVDLDSQFSLPLRAYRWRFTDTFKSRLEE